MANPYVFFKTLAQAVPIRFGPLPHDTEFHVTYVNLSTTSIMTITIESERGPGQPISIAPSGNDIIKKCYGNTVSVTSTDPTVTASIQVSYPSEIEPQALLQQTIASVQVANTVKTDMGQDQQVTGGTTIQVGGVSIQADSSGNLKQAVHRTLVSKGSFTNEGTGNYNPSPPINLGSVPSGARLWYSLSLYLSGLPTGTTYMAFVGVTSTILYATVTTNGTTSGFVDVPSGEQIELVVYVTTAGTWSLAASGWVTQP